MTAPTMSLRSRLWRWCVPALVAWLACAAVMPVHADYDPDVETQRLIDHANAEKAQAKAAIAPLVAKRETLRALFLQINTTQKAISDLLQRVRMTDARNKAMLLIKTGLVSTTAVNGVENTAAKVIADGATEVMVTAGSEFLQNRYPALFDAQAQQLVARFADDGVKAVAKLNWVITLDDEAMAGMIRAETPELARDKGALSDLITGGKLSDDLLVLKRHQYILKAGTEAEQAIGALKQELLKRQQRLLEAIAGLEHTVKMREEDARSWAHSRDMGRAQRDVKIPPPPKPVAYSGDALDYATAAQRIHQAWDLLKSNEVNCDGHSVLVMNADNGGRVTLGDRFRAQVIPTCSQSWSSDACGSVLQRFNATEQLAYDSQVGGALRWLDQQFKLERPKAEAFLARWQAWQHQQINVPTFGPQRTVQFQPGLGADAVGAVWEGSEIALPISYLDEYYNFDMQLPRGGLPQLAEAERRWVVVQAHLRDLEHDLGLAQSADAQARAAGADANALGSQWEPNLRLWGCLGLPNLGGWLADRSLAALKGFMPAYEAGAAAAHQAAPRYVAAVRDRQAKLAQLASALKAEPALLRQQGEAQTTRDKMLEQQRVGMNINTPDAAYSLWRTMTQAGVTEAMVKELTEVVPKLKDTDFALSYALSLAAGADPRHQPVLGPEPLVNLRDTLKSLGAALVPAWNDYQSLYGQLARQQTALDQGYLALRKAVQSALDEPVDWLEPPVYLDPAQFIPASDMPDPTAGVFEQLDRYEALSVQYHALLDKLHPASFAFVRPMEALVKRLLADRGRLMGLDEAAFVQGINVFGSEGERLTQQAVRAGGQLGPQALFAKARMVLLNLQGEISTAYYQGRKAAEVSRALERLLGDVNAYLAKPDDGGTGAGNWVAAIDAALAPAGDAAALRGVGGIAGLLDRLPPLRDKLLALRGTGGEAVVRKFYQDFVATYQARNLRGLLRYMADDWKAADGSDLRDLEDILDNSFRVFDRIVFAMSGLSIQVADGGRFNVSYTATISGHINQMNLNHQETAQVEDTVILTASGPKIQTTRGGRIWLKQ